MLKQFHLSIWHMLSGLQQFHFNQNAIIDSTRLVDRFRMEIDLQVLFQLPTLPEVHTSFQDLGQTYLKNGDLVMYLINPDPFF